MTIDAGYSGSIRASKRPRSEAADGGPPRKRVKRSEATSHITQKIIDESRQIFLQDERLLLARDGVSQVGIKQLSLDRTVYDDINHDYPITVGDKKNIGEQKQSGRCWLFASLNMMRESMLQEHNLTHFEFSQPYLFFWDKFEKVNYFLNLVIKYKSVPVDSESNRSILNFPSYDGGYWNRFVNLVKKYGLAPKSVMAESFHSSDSKQMNNFLESKCREYARDLRILHASGSSEVELMDHKNTILKEVF
jgi:bleomycin hydrolase